MPISKHFERRSGRERGWRAERQYQKGLARSGSERGWSAEYQYQKVLEGGVEEREVGVLNANIKKGWKAEWKRETGWSAES